MGSPRPLLALAFVGLLACGESFTAGAGAGGATAGAGASGGGGAPAGGFGGGTAAGGGGTGGDGGAAGSAGGGGQGGGQAGGGGVAGTGGAGGGVPCDDDDACQVGGPCNGEEDCQDGFCVPGEPPVIDDGDACTIDSCDDQTGKVTHVPVDVDDGNSCTDDTCDPKTGMPVHEVICVCEHSPCKEGAKLDEVACTWGIGNDCVAKVCALMPSCCTAAWDALCIVQVKDPLVCPTGLSTASYSCFCAHSYCSQGEQLEAACDPCVKKVCELDPTCCGESGGTWTAECVAMTHTACNVKNVPGCK